MSSARRSFGRWLATVADQLSAGAGTNVGCCVTAINHVCVLTDAVADAVVEVIANLDPTPTAMIGGMVWVTYTPHVEFWAYSDERIVDLLNEYD